MKNIAFIDKKNGDELVMTTNARVPLASRRKDEFLILLQNQ